VQRSGILAAVEMRSSLRDWGRRERRLTVLMACVLAVLASCGSTNSGDAATWDIHSDNSPSESAETILAYVVRLGCNGGVTGDVLKPIVNRSETDVVVTFRVAAISGVATCPSNQPVPVVVDLGEPIGHRVLVDGACSSGGEAGSTAACTDGGTRWKP
jgi:hypothetical protein